MAAISGKTGTVSDAVGEVIQVTKWTFEPSTPVHKWASNTSNGYKIAVTGPRDGKGTVEIKIDSGVDPAIPWPVGSSVQLTLFADSNSTLEVAAIVASAPVAVDIDNGEPIGATYSFEAHLGWSGNELLASI